MTVEHNRVFLSITTDTRCNRGPSGTVVHGNVGAVAEIDDTLTTINLTTLASLKLTTEIPRKTRKMFSKNPVSFICMECILRIDIV